MFIQIGGKKELSKQEAIDGILVLNNLMTTLANLGETKLLPKIEEKISKLLDLI